MSKPWFPAPPLRPPFLAPALALALCGLLGTGCGSSGRGAIGGIAQEQAGAKPAEAAQAGPRVALIMKTLTNPFFVEMEKGARKAQAETRIDLQVKTATQETSIEQQIELVDKEIKANAKAIVIAPGDSTRLVPVLKKAQDAGIPIVNIDNRLRPEAMAAAGMKPVPFISVDNEQGAYLAAKFLADKVHGPTEAGVLEGIQSAINAQLRKAGAERGLRSNPGIRIVASASANWKIDEAYGVTRKMLKAHPKIGILFCANDMMAIGAIKYLQESGHGKVLVAGFDALQEAKTAIQAGQMAVTVDQQADQQGYLGVASALKLMHGEQVPMDLKVEVRLVTAETLK